MNFDQKITDSQLADIMSTLHDSETGDSKLLKNIIAESDERYTEQDVKSYVGIPENTEDKPFPHNTIAKEVIQSEVLVQADANGNEIIVENTNDAKSLTEVAFDINNTDISGSKDVLKDYGLDDEEAMKLFSIITRFRDGENFNVYTELPETIKNIVRPLAKSSNSPNNTVAKELLNHFIKDMAIDKEFVDLQESLQKELSLTNVSDMYNDDLRNNMEIELLKKAYTLEENGDKDKAELLRKVSDAFKDSYKYTTISLALKENEIIQKKIHKDITRHKRFVNDFNYKYKDSKFKINNIRLIDKVLPPVMAKDGITVSDIKNFVIVICKVTQNMSPDDIEQHTFMYYTIQNILMLKYTDLENSAFGKEVYNNLLNAINLMKEVDKYGNVSSRSKN